MYMCLYVLELVPPCTVPAISCHVTHSLNGICRVVSEVKRMRMWMWMWTKTALVHDKGDE